MHRSLHAAILAAFAFPALSLAQAVPLTPAVRTSVINATVARVTSTYVDADTALLIAIALREREKQHAYDSITNPAQLAEVMTRDLRSVNGDLHLSLRYNPAPPSRGGGSPFGDPRQLNFGMGRAEILDGNVGYLEITGFTGGDYKDAVVDALRFLSRTDAMIIDVRRNPGGASDMSHFIFSHFLGAQAVPTINVRTRASSEPRRGMSLADVPGPRRPDVPLYVLTSQGTASAAEEFSFVLKNKKRATIVGTRTAGAGHMVTSVDVGDGFAVSLSITRVSDPATGREWEAVGVQPDISVKPEQALDAAHAAALKVIAASAEPARVRVLARLTEVVEARSRSAVSDPTVARFAGSYEGRTIEARDGRLWYARQAGALGIPLVPLGSDVFAIGSQRLRFAETAGSMSVVVEQADGTFITLMRAPG